MDHAARFPLFDGLRALAAVSVLAFHASLDTNAEIGQGGLSPYLARLNVGVAVFFVISGFLLYRPMLAARVGQGPEMDARGYARRRVLRIVPAYWVALTLLSAWPGLSDVRTGHWWIYYAFGQGYSNGTASQGIGPAWTLGCELVFYAMLPFISLAFDRLARATGRRAWWQLELAGLGVLSAGGVAYGIVALGDPALPQTTFAATFGWFALGMALAIVSVLGPEHRTAAAERWAWLGWPLAFAAFLVICRGIGLQRTGYAAAQTPTQLVLLYLLSGIVAAGLALPAVFERQPRSAVGRLLAHRWIAWLGLISYGIYLYHAPVLTALKPLTYGHAATTRMLILVPAAFAVTIAAASLSYYVVERPALRARRRAAKPAAVPARATASV